MPIHEWTRVDAGIFHHFHQRWIGAITDVFNQRLLPREYYALAEQQGAGFEDDVLTLKAAEAPQQDDDGSQPPAASRAGVGDGNGIAGGSMLVAEPPARITAETGNPGRYVGVPLEETYRLAFESVPRRWRTVLEPR